jgi:hypothetical protein
MAKGQKLTCCTQEQYTADVSVNNANLTRSDFTNVPSRDYILIPSEWASCMLTKKN